MFGPTWSKLNPSLIEITIAYTLRICSWLEIDASTIIVNMIPFVNISNFLKWKNIYIMAFTVARSEDTLDDNQVVF